MNTGSRWNLSDDGDVADGMGGRTAMRNRRTEAAAADPGTGPDPRRMLAWIPFGLALAWLAWLALAAAGTVPPLPPTLDRTMLLASAPIVMALLFYVVLARGGHGEVRRFARVATDMQARTDALDAALIRISVTVGDQNRLLAEQAERLMALGDDAADRIGAVRAGFARDAASFAEQGAALAHATDAARAVLAVLLTDLPDVDSQLGLLTDRLRSTGIAVQEQAGTLADRLTTVADSGRDAERIAGEAVDRLGRHLARIDRAGTGLAERIDTVGTHAAGVADGALERMAHLLDELHGALGREQDLLHGIVQDARGQLGEAGAATLAAVRGQLDLIDTRLCAFGERVAREGDAMATLAAALGQDLERAAERFDAIGQSGGAVTLRLVEGLADVRRQGDDAATTLDAGGDAVDRLVARADGLTQAMDGIGIALADADMASTRIVARVEQTSPTLVAFADTAGDAADSLDRAGASVVRHRAAIAELDAAIARTDTDTQALAERAVPLLRAALDQIRAAAEEAAGQTRAAFATIGPDVAAQLAAITGGLVGDSVSADVEHRLRLLSDAATQAADTAAAAAAHLARELATIADTTAAVEARITETRQETEEADSASFSQRVALLIESLNSTAIDMTRILSSDVADGAWAAYLRGDRGVFTRRAVRLLDQSEARAVVTRYGDDPDFQSNVNRYVHDFEAMLRRVLAGRDGTMLGVTLLSSDMGKLYVALAQAIERLRA